MKLLLLACCLVAGARADGCPSDYFSASRTCTNSDDCYPPDICFSGTCCTAAVEICPAGTSLTQDKCDRFPCDAGHICHNGRCCKVEFCTTGFHKTGGMCTSGLMCEATGYCMHGLCCDKNPEPSCPAGFLLSPKTCSSNTDCGTCATDTCVGGHCCQEAQCHAQDKRTSLQCDREWPCPGGHYCRAGICCESTVTDKCPKPTYFVGKLCSSDTECDMVNDMCTNGQCCRQAADTCPSGYRSISLSCHTNTDCPVGGAYKCFDGRCCREVEGNCPPTTYYIGKTCDTDSECGGTGDKCIGGQCCRPAAESCPAMHSKYYKDPECNNKTPCVPGYTCIKGLCCQKMDCYYRYYLSSQKCVTYDECKIGDGGYCNKNLCCKMEKPICRKKQELSTRTCTTSEQCSGGTCLTDHGVCCLPATCKETYKYTSTSCSRYRPCPEGMHCHFGSCCKKTDMCGSGKWRVGECKSDADCSGPETSCNTQHGQCCRKIATTCPAEYTYSSRICANSYCYPGHDCIQGRCCRRQPVECQDGYLKSGKTCESTSDCDRWGYCLYSHCCEKVKQCPAGYKPPYGEHCRSSGDCTQWSSCIDSLCCPKVNCKSPDRYTDQLCSTDGDCDGTGSYCNYGKCCRKD